MFPLSIPIIIFAEMRANNWQSRETYKPIIRTLAYLFVMARIKKKGFFRLRLVKAASEMEESCESNEIAYNYFYYNLHFASETEKNNDKSQYIRKLGRNFNSGNKKSIRSSNHSAEIFDDCWQGVLFQFGLKKFQRKVFYATNFFYGLSLQRYRDINIFYNICYT